MRSALAERSAVLELDFADATLAVILAGGRGERLGPLTRDRAKPAVPFGADGCVIDSTLSNCLRSGIPRTLVLTQYCSDSIAAHLRETRIPDSISVLDGRSQLGHAYRGTADAVRQSRETIEASGARWVVVASGDHVYRMDYRAMIAEHVGSGAAATIAATPVSLAEARRMGVMTVDRRRRIRGFHEKPRLPAAMPGAPRSALASMGVYVFDVEALFSALDAGDDDFGGQLIPRMLRDGIPLFAYSFDSYWRDIGTIDSYFAASMDLAAATAGGSALGAGSRAAGARVARSVIGTRSSLASHAVVEDAVLFRSVTVGRGARVRRAILDDEVVVMPGASVGISPDEDRARYAVTDEGIVVVPRGTIVDR